MGRHGRIRADSRDSARPCRFATSSGSYLLGRSPDRNGRGWTDFADLCLTTWLRRREQPKVAIHHAFGKSCGRTVSLETRVVAIMVEAYGVRHDLAPDRNRSSISGASNCRPPSLPWRSGHGWRGILSHHQLQLSASQAPGSTILLAATGRKRLGCTTGRTAPSILTSRPAAMLAATRAASSTKEASGACFMYAVPTRSGAGSSNSGPVSSRPPSSAAVRRSVATPYPDGR